MQSFESIECPEQIDGRGTTPGEVFDDFLKTVIEAGTIRSRMPLQTNDDSVGSGDSNGRCSTNSKRLDRFPDGLDVAAVNRPMFDGQKGLVDHPDRGEVIPEPITRPAQA